MSVSIQSSNGISVVTKNGHVKIEGAVKSVRINGVSVSTNNPSNPTLPSKPWWKFW